MVFWILVAGLVAAVTLAITWPLMRQPAQAATDADADADIAVYKDQLKEVTADEARGTLAANEAENARAEIARRLLRVTQDTPKSETAARAAARNRFILPVSLLTSVALPVASLGLYLAYGAPGMPAQPLSERLAEANVASKPNDLIAKVEQRLREHPEDGTGWDVIAPVYYAMGRYVDAATAYQNALRLIGADPRRLQGFANSRIRLENGIVPDDARKALQQILVLAPKSVEPRIWLALAKEQDGNLTEAAADYKSLLAQAPSDAPWRPVVEERLARLEPKGNTAPGTDQSAGANAPPAAPAAPQAPAGPDASAVMSMSPEQRQAFIGRMVDGLAARLKTDGSDAEGWVKLIRAYQVLGRRDDAVKALNDARTNLKGNQGGLAQVEDLARQLGLGS
ncbi:c-type cytochrome biogenesis protein CcmI [Hyphomicrobium sp.]|jgi:cytochrome c-type biogenesis protein CcmH|uniref:c-type cytochrome biogenesis protein CcmI n=1 Tax=Hyphomicrobium sp. TaxID=82 RepID=UPI003564B21A